MSVFEVADILENIIFEKSDLVSNIHLVFSLEIYP